MFVYQPTFNTMKKKKDNTKYFIDWKWKGVYNSKLTPLHGALLPNIKYFGNKIGMQFNNTPMVVE